MNKFFFVTACLVTGLWVGPVAAAGSGPALTVYEQGAAVVSSSRQIELAAGRQWVRLDDLPGALLPESLFVRSPGVRLAGLRFGEKLLSRANLLERFIGRQVTLLRDDGQGGDVRAQATLLSMQGGTPVVRVEDRIELLSSSPWRIAMETLPDDLPTSPLLGLDLRADAGGVQPLALTYQVNGLSWGADHLAVYDEDDGELSLTARARLSNNSDGDYQAARLSLISGAIQRQGGARPQLAYARSESRVAADVSQSPAFEYHRFAIQRPVTLLDGESRLLPLLSGSVAVEREYRIENGGYSRSGERSHARVHLLFENDLGAPLPAGTVRVYDGSQAPLLLGEDRIGHLPEGVEAELTLGQSFDITAERTVTEQERDGRVRESARRVVVENAKDESVKVRIIESLPGDWEILSENLPHEKLDASRLTWIVGVPAGGKAALKYRVRYR